MSVRTSISIETSILRAYSERRMAFHNTGLQHTNYINTTDTGFGIREENRLSMDMDALRAMPLLKIEWVCPDYFPGILQKEFQSSALIGGQRVTDVVRPVIAQIDAGRRPASVLFGNSVHTGVHI